MTSSRTGFVTIQAVIGGVILLLGLGLLLENLGYTDIGNIFRYWPILLIVFGLAKLFEPGAKVFALVVTLVGLLLLLDKLDVVSVNLWSLWPLLLVLIGVSMIWQVFAGKSAKEERSGTVSQDNFFSGTAFMGGFKRQSTTRDFRGAELSVIMGGCEIDLHAAAMQAAQATIRVSCIAGGVELSVPEEWDVVIEVSPFLGGVEDKTRHPANGGTKRLIVRGVIVAGGVEVKN